MEIQKIKNDYESIIVDEKVKLAKVKKSIFQVGTLRLVIVLLACAGIYFLWGNTPILIALIIVFAIVFGVLLKYHNRLFKRKLYSEIRIQDAANELKGLDYDFSAFDGATEKIDAEHSYSLDLDLFGERSFFQSLNRTVTSFGKDALANSLIYPAENKSDILARQEAIKELRDKIKLASHFRTVGQMSEADNLNLKDFSDSFSTPPSFFGNRLWTSLTYLVPALYIVLGILCIFNLASSGLFMPLWLVTLILGTVPMKRTTALGNLFDKNTAVLETYSDLFKIIENETFTSRLLVDNQALLKAKSASQAIEKLKSYNNNLLQSTTFPVMLFFNPVLLWNVRYARQIEKWMQTYKEDINTWFEAIAQFDSLVSLAIFAYNHPDYTYPQIADSFTFDGTELGHPLIHRDACVRNDVSITKSPYFLVVTGANMAGKSTYLRTIGINHILASAGASVCAKSLHFYPSKLLTNLRTSDSLADNESYFFAELKRLKMIIDRLQSGEQLFIILDEILKGTNSEDKQKGSLALMKQLVSLGGNGIIATHDLVLGKLEQEYPDNVKDFCFEADIKNDQLSFSYKIREGIAQNMNACFLMKKMGITGL